MKVVLRNERTGNLVNLVTDEESHPDVYIQIFYHGSDEDIQAVKEALMVSYGAYGHRFNIKAPTNFDLYVAVHNLNGFKLLDAEPTIKANPDFPPPGAVS